MDADTSAEPTPQVTHAQAEHRFDLSLSGRRIGVAEYADHAGRRHFVHTEVAPAYGGQGMAGILIGAALDETRETGLRVVPECEFVQAFIDKHPEYKDITDPVE